ncbi:MAG: hypothetical protein QM784_40760 [Polyangiaceae bacterium]
MTSLTGDAWSRLNERLGLVERLQTSADPVYLGAEFIKEATGREPRLMCKFDTRESRPRVLSEATVLPVNNGTYVVLAGDGYADVPAPARVKYWRPPEWALRLCTLPWKSGPSSESQALDMATATGLLHDFLRDPGACLTVRGRLRSPKFSFEFDTRHGSVPVTVDGVQVEVDSGFEGAELHLIEAKLGARTNFHIRQTYYPLRMWERLLPSKARSAVFLTWSNRCFSLRKVRFEPSECYHGLRFTDSVDYYLDEPGPIPTFEELLSSTDEEDASLLPFPQADDVRRVIDVVDAVEAGVTARTGIAMRFDVNERQADYYANAAAYLGLVRRGDGGFEQTELGRTYVGLSFASRQATLLRQMARRPVFRQAMALVSAKGVLPSQDQVSEWISLSTGLTGNTSIRRARTVLSWIRWAQQASNPTQLDLFDRR